MPIIYEREKINYVHKQDINRILKDGGAIYTPNIYKNGGAVYKAGSKNKDGENVWDSLKSVGNWISNNSQTIGNVSSAIGNVAGTITGITKSAVEIDNMRKMNDTQMQAIRDKTKADIDQIRNTNKLKRTEITDENIKSGGNYNLDSLKTKPKFKKDTSQSDKVVSKILGRSKRDIIEGSGFKLVME